MEWLRTTVDDPGEYGTAVDITTVESTDVLSIQASLKRARCPSGKQSCVGRGAGKRSWRPTSTSLSQDGEVFKGSSSQECGKMQCRGGSNAF